MDGVPRGRRWRGRPGGSSGPWHQTLDTGCTILGEGPRPVHAHARGVLAEVAPAGQAVAAAAADHVPLAADEVAGLEVGDVRADRSTVPRTRGPPPWAPGSSSGPRRPSCRCGGRCRRSRSSGPDQDVVDAAPGPGPPPARGPARAGLFTRAFMVAMGGSFGRVGRTRRARPRHSQKSMRGWRAQVKRDRPFPVLI